MLFDLRGRGRRSTIKVIYVLLAILMGGGLVLFGIGGATNGGLVDAITGSKGGTDNSKLEDRVKKDEKTVAVKPQDAAAWAELARARYLLVTSGKGFDRNKGTFTDDGKAALQQVSDAWQKHLSLAGDKPDDGLASLMVQAYGPAGLNQLDKAAGAQEVITTARPSSSTYYALAVLSYAANQTRKGDLAGQKAVDLADKASKSQMKAQIAEVKQQALQQQVQDAQPSATPTIVPGD